MEWLTTVYQMIVIYIQKRLIAGSIVITLLTPAFYTDIPKELEQSLPELKLKFIGTKRDY